MRYTLPIILILALASCAPRTITPAELTAEAGYNTHTMSVAGITVESSPVVQLENGDSWAIWKVRDGWRLVVNHAGQTPAQARKSTDGMTRTVKAMTDRLCYVGLTRSDLYWTEDVQIQFLPDGPTITIPREFGRGFLAAMGELY